jgi:hypothetical protein
MAVVDGIYIPSAGLPPDSFFSWEDEYGNSVLPVFTDKQQARSFVQTFAPDYRADGYGPMDAMEVITDAAKRGVAFFAVDPENQEHPKKLELFELLFKFIKLAYLDGVAGVEWWEGQFDREPGD